MADEGLKSTPEGASVIMALADLYFQNGMFEQAIDLAKSAIEKNPETVEAYIILAKVYKEKGDVEKSQEFAEKGLEIAPQNKELEKYSIAYEEIPEKIRPEPIGTEEQKEEVEEEKITEEVSSEETTEDIEKEKTEMSTSPKEKVFEEKTEESSRPAIIEESPPPQEEVVQEKRENTIEDVLTEITDINDIFGALVIDETGLPIAQKLNISLDIESTSALISVINKESRESIGRMGIGKFQDSIIEMEKGKIFIFDIPPVVLSVLADKKVMMGLIMVKVRNAIKVIRKVLEI